MPTYQYRCDKCEKIFDIFHAMSESIESCEMCNSPVIKVPVSGFNITKSNVSRKLKPGKLVTEYIKDVKEDLKEERERLASQEYAKE
jgi:putative FmdB family regulatory protein